MSGPALHRNAGKTSLHARVLHLHRLGVEPRIIAERLACDRSTVVKIIKGAQCL